MTAIGLPESNVGLGVSRRDCERGEGVFRALTINIGAASVERAPRILAWLTKRNADALVLTETSGGKGTEFLRVGLEEAGYHTLFSGQDTRDRSVLMASRIALTSLGDLGISLPWRVAAAELATQPRIVLVGVYVPSRDRSPAKIEKKERFLRTLHDALRRLEVSNVVMCGDYNVLARTHSPRPVGYFDFEYAWMDALDELGFLGGHELEVGAQPHSWIGRNGRGYLYDYIHIGGALRDRVVGCVYDHAPRRRRLTDHAAVEFQCRLDDRLRADGRS